MDDLGTSYVAKYSRDKNLELVSDPNFTTVFLLT